MTASDDNKKEGNWASLHLGENLRRGREVIGSSDKGTCIPGGDNIRDKRPRRTFPSIDLIPSRLCFPKCARGQEMVSVWKGELKP